MEKRKGWEKNMSKSRKEPNGNVINYTFSEREKTLITDMILTGKARDISDAVNQKINEEYERGGYALKPAPDNAIPSRQQTKTSLPASS